MALTLDSDAQHTDRYIGPRRPDVLTTLARAKMLRVRDWRPQVTEVPARAGGRSPAPPQKRVGSRGWSRHARAIPARRSSWLPQVDNRRPIPIGALAREMTKAIRDLLANRLDFLRGVGLSGIHQTLEWSRFVIALLPPTIT